MMSRRLLVAAAFASLLAASCSAATAASWPSLFVQVRPQIVAGGSDLVVSVRVLRHRSDPPRLGVQGAIVTLAGHTARTGPHGLVRVRVRFPCHGDVTVVARRRGFRPGSATIYVLAAAEAAARADPGINLPTSCL
jgi:hypothetical protein